MKKMDYTIGFAAGQFTATALTDRARVKTPKRLTFADRQETLKFLKESQSEGYRFSGAEFVDPDQKLVKNRYFTIGDDGALTSAGEDNGPRDTVYEVGDIKSRPTEGVEAVIEAILQGTGVRERFGCDLAFLLRVYPTTGQELQVTPPFPAINPCPCGLHGKSYGDCCRDKGVHALGNQMLRGAALRMVDGALEQTQSSMVLDNTRFRMVWNNLWHQPQQETFHQFLDVLVVRTLGQEWFDEQTKLEFKRQSAIVKWRAAMLDLQSRPSDVDDGMSTGHTLTGPAKAYLCFAYDLYWLQMAHRLPESLITRLKTFDKFQGARYEVLVAAVFARAGFDIEWYDDTKAVGKHPEFMAIHRRTGWKVGIEAKSRLRSGAMNFIGEVSIEGSRKGDVFGLYATAIKQAPEGSMPFLIFIDPNVPDSPTGVLHPYSEMPVDAFPWMREIRDGLVAIWDEATAPTPESAVMITNLAFYYGDNESPSPAGMGSFFPSPNPKVPILGEALLADILYSVQNYGTVPRQI